MKKKIEHSLDSPSARSTKDREFLAILVRPVAHAEKYLIYLNKK